MKKFKVCLACILAILCAASAIPVYGADAASPTSGQCGENVFWNLDSDGTLTISGEGEMYDYTSNISAPWKKSEVKKLIIEKGVTSIGNYAFFRCNELTSVNISDSVERIGRVSFDDCTALTEINISEGVTEIQFAAFRSCSSLTSVTIPGSVKTIGLETFRLCKALTSVNICNGVEIIGGFEDCTSLEEINIPNSVTEIDFAAFRDCSSLTSVTIPGSVKTIGTEAFSLCKALTDVFYNNTVENWDKINILYRNDSLLKANIHFLDKVPCGDNLRWTLDENGTLTISGEGEMYDFSSYLDFSAPWDRTAIKKVVIEDGVTSIGPGAFENCEYLEEISIPESVEWIGDGAFSGCRKLSSLSLPDSITYISDSVFNNCSSLETIIIPDSVTAIDSAAFSGCSSLKTVNIPERVTHINSYTFHNCSSLVSITLPSRVDYVVRNAFDGCDSLKDIYYNGNSRDKWQHITNNGNSLPNVTVHFSDHAPCGIGLDWTLDEDGTLTISGKGEMYNYDRFYNSDRPWDDNINDIRAVIIEEGVTSIGDYAFHECWRLSSISIPSSVKSIGAVAFSGCSNLEELVLPEGVVSIGESAFSKSGLKALSLPASIEQIDEKAFYMTIVESIEVSEDSPLYSSKDGVLFSKDGTELVFFPAGRTGSYTIPDRVETVCPRAFSWFRLDSLTILSDVMFFEKYAFDNPWSSSFKIYYEGTEEQWNNMFIEAGNDDLLDSEVVCFTYGDTDGSGGIDLRDSCALKALIMGVEADDSSYRAGDMNNDGRVDTRDAFLLKRMLLLGR